MNVFVKQEGQVLAEYALIANTTAAAILDGWNRFYGSAIENGQTPHDFEIGFDEEPDVAVVVVYCGGELVQEVFTVMAQEEK